MDRYCRNDVYGQYIGNVLRRMKQPSVSEAWVTKSVFSIRPYIKAPKNKYFEGIKPLIILQRTLGRFPYSFNKHGFNPFKLLSFTTLYTVVFFSVQSAWTIYTMFVIAKLKIYNAPSYDEVLYWISIGLLLLLNFTTPITKWIDARRHVQFVNSWQDFQVNYMKCELQMTLAQPIKIIAILILPAALVFMILETYLLNNLPFLVILPFVSAISAASTTLIHWCVTLYELRVVSRHLLSKIIMNGCRQMSRYRRTWLELSKLVSAVGEAHAYTGMMMSVIFFISIILSTYTILSSLFESETVSNNVWGLIMGAIIGFLCNFILYDAAYRTTQEVGPNFSSKILNLDLTHLSQGEINEISLLIQTMSAHPPLIEYLGFVTINRNLFLSTISNAVTYLVVLVQFKASSPMDANNEEVQ